MKERVERKGSVVRIYAQSGFLKHVNGKVLCKVENTGNGYIAKVRSFSSAADDNFFRMDYSEAALIFKALKAFALELEAEDES